MTQKTPLDKLEPPESKKVDLKDTQVSENSNSPEATGKVCSDIEFSLIGFHMKFSLLVLELLADNSIKKLITVGHHHNYGPQFSAG